MASRRAGLVVVVVVAILVAIAPASAQEPTAGGASPEALRSVTVTPRTGLVDDQAILISGRNFRPGTFVDINMCRTGRPAYVRCDLSSFDYTSVDEMGRWSLIFHVDAIVETGAGPYDCRPAAGRCDLRIMTEDGFFLRKSLTFEPGSPLAAAPEFAATPNTDLVDGQIIDVEGSGFHPQSPYLIRHCLAGADTELFCDGVTFDAETDVDGNLSRQLSVSPILNTPDGGDLDCRENVCELVAAPANDSRFNRAGRAPVEFDQAGVLQPPPVFSVDPDTGLTGRQTVTVAGTGFRPLTDVVLLQCKPTVDVFTGCSLANFAFAEVPADGTFSQPFEVRRRISFFDGSGPRDCTTRPCVIAALTFVNPVATHPITFAPL